MLIKKKFLNGIAEGRVSLAFRRWKRPTVKPGGSLRTVIGVLAIDAVDKITESKITKRDAVQAGYADRAELITELNSRKEGELYRIKLRFAGSDPRIELRQKVKFSNEEFEEVKKRLSRMDSRSSLGPWTLSTLNQIDKNPGKRAPDLAAQAGVETKRFKTNVRKLKEMGLTESLAVGYRLSPRGKAVLDRLMS